MLCREREGDDQAPLAWDLSWLRLARWVEQTYPSRARREHRVLEALCEGLSSDDATTVREAVSALFGLGSSSGELQVLRAYIRFLRAERSEPGLVRLEFALTVIDAANRFLAPNPFVHAVEAMGWTCVPSELASMAIELGLLVRLHAHGSSSSPAIPALEPEPVDPPIEPEFEDDLEYERYRRVKPRRRRSGDAVERLAALAERLAGSMPRLDWRRGLEADDHRVGDRRIEECPRYCLGMLERLPRTEPRGLEVYEAIADTVEPSALDASERAITVFVDAQQSDELRARTRLRAALRRVARGSSERVHALGVRAHKAMTAVGSVAGTCAAAAVVGYELEQQGADDAARWLERALALADPQETPQFRLILLAALHDSYGRVGDELGQHRTERRARQLRRAHEDLGELYRAIWEPEPEPEPEREPDPAPPLPPELRRAQRLLEEGLLGSVYEQIGDYIGGLFEQHDRATVANLLESLVERRRVDDLLNAWLCGAIAELVVDDDHSRWETYKTMQLDIEDARGVDEAEVTSLEFVHKPWMLDPEDPAALEQIRQIRLRTRAVHCITQAETALEEGAAPRARFWTERARRYRERLDP